MKSFVLALASVLLASAACLAAWGPGGCYLPPSGPVGPLAPFHLITPPAPVEQPAFRWELQDTGWHYLYFGQQIQGAYKPDEGYRAWISYGVWAEPVETCPIAPPIPPVKSQSFGQWQLDGVDESKLSQGLKLSRKGKPIDESEALEALQFGQLVDDSGKPSMVVIGEASHQQKVKDLIAASGKLKDVIAAAGWKVYYVKPDSWETQGWKKKKTGTPWIVWMRADQKDPRAADAIYDIIDVASGDDLLAAVQEATKRLDPNYNPSPLPALPDLQDVPYWFWLIGGAVLYLLLSKKPVPPAPAN